ncbi:MAG: DUF447 family protein [Methanobacterium sp.]|uniref:DUF447 domain-containing protein n=1 Tax=Methanobacterium sp. TaxID=2164 RepID=UPI003D64EBCE|nr:DUF447 family protein [Methanobacterium sp.]
MHDLTSIGMKKGLLYETVLSTENPDKTPNAAPIGVICKDKNEIVLYLYEGTQTVENIKSNKIFTVNILKDPLIFVECTIGDLSSDKFKLHENGFYIENTDAFFNAEVKDIKEVQKEDKIGKSKLNIITAQVTEIITKNECVKPLNRAIFAIIESLVYLTRIDKVNEDTSKLYLNRINEMSRLVNRVGGLNDKEAMKKILKHVQEK